VGLHLTPEIAFNFNFAVRDGMDDFVDLLGREFFGTQIGVNVRLLKDALGRA
jgi:hypothetical protein